MDLDKIINNFYNKRYSYLIECAQNCLLSIKRQDLKGELVTESYLYITNNKEKLKDLLENNKIEAIAVNWMKMQIKWGNSSFKRDWVYKNNKNQSIDTISIVIADEEITEEEYLQEEKEIQDKVNYIYDKISNSSLDKKLLFDTYFNLGINTCGKLSKYTGICRTTCYHMIKALKDDLKNNYQSKDNL